MLQSEKDYRERVDGKTWPEIAGDRTTKGVFKAAKRWAQNRKLPWPPASFDEVGPTRRQRKMRALGKKVYQARMRQMNRKWPPEVTRVDRIRARKYAEAEGLPWPPPRRTKQQVAYELREDGLSWDQVAARAGYKHSHHACAAGRKWAEKAGLPWPIKTD